MRDQYFSYFIEKFGEATSSTTVPSESIVKWKGILPEVLLTYWETEGWGSYHNGLFSLVNPDDFEEILDMWLEDTQFEEMDSYHVIAINGFGDLYAFGESTGRNITIIPMLNQIIYDGGNYKKKSKDALNSEIKSFLAASSLNGFDLMDSSDNYLFDKATGKYGVLANNEIFGLVPAFVLGGDIELNNLRKLDCQVHLMILRELAQPEIISY